MLMLSPASSHTLPLAALLVVWSFLTTTARAWTVTTYYTSATITWYDSTAKASSTRATTHFISPTVSPLPRALTTRSSFNYVDNVLRYLIELPTGAGVRSTNDWYNSMPHTTYYLPQTYSSCTPRATHESTTTVATLVLDVPTAEGVVLQATSTWASSNGFGPFGAALVRPTDVDPIERAYVSHLAQPTNCARQVSTLDFSQLCDANPQTDRNGTFACGKLNKCCYRCKYMQWKCPAATATVTSSASSTASSLGADGVRGADAAATETAKDPRCPADPGPFWRCTDGNDYFLNGTVTNKLFCASTWTWANNHCEWIPPMPVQTPAGAGPSMKLATMLLAVPAFLGAVLAL